MKKQLLVLGMLVLGLLKINASILFGPACACPKNKGESSASVQKRNKTVNDCINKYGYGQLKTCCKKGKCIYTNNQ